MNDEQPVRRKRTRAEEWRIAGGIIAGIALVVAVIYAWNERQRRYLEGEYYVPKVSKVTPEIVLLQQYVRIDTVNPPGNEIAGARFLKQQLDAAGVRSEIIESAPGRANLYARIRGRQPGQGLLLLNHIDVVPASPGGWTRPPFEADIALNMMFGRGTLDMKSIAICELQGFLAVARSGRMPERDIVFLAVADEEAGGALGTRWLLDHRPEVFDGIRYALNEGGITETLREKLTYFGVEVGTKQIVDVELQAKTREELQHARLALEPYFNRDRPDRILPEVRKFLRELAPRRFEFRPLLADIDAAVANGQFWSLPPGYRELMQNVVWASSITQVDDHWIMRVQLFNLPDEQPDARLSWLTEVTRPYGVSLGKIIRKEGPVPLSSDQTPLFALLDREVHAVYGNVPVGIEILTTSNNDSRYLRPRGIECYGLYPFPVDFYQTQGVHGRDERIRLDWYMEGVDLMKRVITQYATLGRQSG